MRRRILLEIYITGIIGRINYIFNVIINTLPFKLFVSQIRNHWYKLFFWLFITLVVSGNLMEEVGGPYLFWEPEYLGKSDKTAFFILGICFGIFFITYQLAMYIAELYQYTFILFQEAPFVRFVLNNSIIPLIFLFTYVYSFVKFNSDYGFLSGTEIFFRLFSFGVGAMLVIGILLFYFSQTNKDIIHSFGEKVVKELQNPRMLLTRARRIYRIQSRVSYYIDTDLSVKKVNPRLQCDIKMLFSVINQNHINALMIQLLLFVLFILLGYFQDSPYAQIPAAGSFLILFSILLMLVSAISFWFQKVGILTLILLGFIGYNLFTNTKIVHHNKLFGLDYNKTIVYSDSLLENIVSNDSFVSAYYNGVVYLNNWKKKIEKKYKVKKPVFVIVCSSGGGLRSALWSFRNLQVLDSLTNGKAKDYIGLITGASGGILGTAYFRELMQQKLSEDIDLYSPEYYENISKDLLNAVIFSTTVNFIYPFFSFEVSGKKYKKDVGYAFEKRLIENLNAFHNKTLSDYYFYEKNAKIPLLIVSPTIITDGKQLLVSSQNVSYLANSKVSYPFYSNEISGVPFSEYFKEANADSTLYTSILRANAGFPGIIPAILLPTSPPIQIMDAGLYDNFGLDNALKFIYTFKNWLKNNTSKVLIIQLRDTEQKASIKKEALTLWNKIQKTFTGTFYSFSESKDYQNDWTFAFLKNCLGDKLQMIELSYYNDSDFNYASLSFHLVSWEKQDILKKVYSKTNWRKLNYIKKLLYKK